MTLMTSMFQQNSTFKALKMKTIYGGNDASRFVQLIIFPLVLMGFCLFCRQLEEQSSSSLNYLGEC